MTRRAKLGAFLQSIKAVLGGGIRGGQVRSARMCTLVNNRRLLEPIRNIPSAEAEARYYAAARELLLAA